MTNETNETNEPTIEETAPVDAAPDTQNSDDDTPVLAGAHPTVAEAEAMFADNKGLSSVLTDKGILTRDGVIIHVPQATGE